MARDKGYSSDRANRWIAWNHAVADSIVLSGGVARFLSRIGTIGASRRVDPDDALCPNGRRGVLEGACWISQRQGLFAIPGMPG
jgi:hypothetical protein